MADPFTWASIGIAAKTAGAGLGVVGAIGGGYSKANQFGYQAGMARLKEQIDKQNANYARTTGDVQSRQFGLKAGQQLGKMKAAQGTSGLDVNFGSSAGVRSSQLAAAQTDEATIQSNAARKAYGFDIEAAVDRANAKNFDRAASSAITGGYLGATGSLLGGVASVSDKWLQATSQGIFGSSTSGIPFFAPDDL